MKKTKNKKLHIEIMPLNSGRLDSYIDEYNNNPKRVTPNIKVPDVINMALDIYLTKIEINNRTGI